MGYAGLKDRCVATALLCALIAPGGAQAAANGCNTPSVTVNAQAMSDEDLRVFGAAVRSAIAKVCAWWGPTFDGPFTINVEDTLGPSMAMIPYWRGRPGTILFRSGKTRERKSPIEHEVTHVFAPNANRFVAEGLAVYAHEHLGGQPAYPTFGHDLHRAAQPFAGDADLPALDAIVTPKGLRTENRPEQKKAYTVAGSFVRFLIETRGLEKFRALYALTPMVPGKRIPSDPARWQSVYGAPLDALSADWKTYVAAR